MTIGVTDDVHNSSPSLFMKRDTRRRRRMRVCVCVCVWEPASQLWQESDMHEGTSVNEEATKG